LDKKADDLKVLARINARIRSESVRDAEHYQFGFSLLKLRTKPVNTTETPARRENISYSFLSSIVIPKKLKGRKVFVTLSGEFVTFRRWDFLSFKKGFVFEAAGHRQVRIWNPYREPVRLIKPRTMAAWHKPPWIIRKELRKKIHKERFRNRNLTAIQPENFIHSKTKYLPEKILVIDIETSGQLTDKPSLERIALVGVKEFARKRTGFLPLPHESYRHGDWHLLANRLSSFKGLILGFNLLGFDFHFLRILFDIRTVFESSVDVFAWLISKTGGHEGNVLEYSSREVLRSGKLYTGKSIKKLLKENDWAQLSKYNERDLDLTFRLWLKAVKEPNFRELTVNRNDIEYLLGQRKLIPYEEWTTLHFDWSKRERNSALFDRIISDRYGPIEQTFVWPQYFLMLCTGCDKVWWSLTRVQRKTSIVRGRTVFELMGRRHVYRLSCPTCGKAAKVTSRSRPEMVGEVKAPLYMRSSSRKEFRELSECRLSWFIQPSTFKMLRDFWSSDATWQAGQNTGADTCTVCSHQLRPHDLAIRETLPICRTCFRLGRSCAIRSFKGWGIYDLHDEPPYYLKDFSS
jgi:hypothetical protein